MDLAGQVLSAGQAVRGASATALPDALNAFIETFSGSQFKAKSGSVRDADGQVVRGLASVIHVDPAGTHAGNDFSADATAAVIDACVDLDLGGLRSAYARVRDAKRLRKSPLPTTKGAVSNVTLGVVLGLRSALPLETIAQELDRLNAATPGAERPDMIVVAETGTINYIVQFPSESTSGDFLPPGPGALDAYTPPMYIITALRPTGAHSLNRMLAFLFGHLAIFSPGTKLPPWNEMLAGSPQQAVTTTGYQYNLSGELVPVPREFYNDRYLPPRPMLVEAANGELLATLQFLPWQDGGAILLKGKLPLEGLMIFLGQDALKRGGVINLKEGQLSYVLPITAADFGRMLSRLQAQSNMVVRPYEPSWIVKKYSDEGSSSPVMTRLFISPLKLRDTVFPDPGARDGFDKAYEVMLTALLGTRKAAQEILRLWQEHAAKVASGEIARVDRSTIHIDQNADTDLRQQTEAFLNAAVRAIKLGMQGVCTQLKVDIGFLFQKQTGFDEGLKTLRASDPALAAYLGETRRWSDILVNRRNAIEHEGWMLPPVGYTRTGNTLAAVEPTVDGRGVCDFASYMLDRLLCFSEEVTVHCLQRQLPAGFSFTELPLAGRLAEMPERFQTTVAVGGLPPWVLSSHASSFEHT